MATGLTVDEQVKLALRFYASGSFLQVIGDEPPLKFIQVNGGLTAR
jgi:hypothetical protein